MNLICFDGPERNNFLPLTYTRPVADLRIGILTLREKWEKILGLKSSTLTQDYLQEKWPFHPKEKNLFINPAYIPTDDLVEKVKNLQWEESLVYEHEIVAVLTKNNSLDADDFRSRELIQKPFHIKYPWDIFSKNYEAIELDFDRITKDRQSEPVPSSVFNIHPEKIFIEKGAKLYTGSLNAESGPIYIGENAEIREGAHIRGPFAIGEGGRVQMGSMIYEGSTVGPYSVVGGELRNSVIIGYSNKGHSGYLGNSVIGEWCNLGADTNNSNLKNNYAEVRLWNYDAERFLSTGLQKCGLIMGDHSKSSINTMFNTGTVVGVNANIFGSGFPRNFVPDFTWGGVGKMITYQTTRALEVAESVMELAGSKLSDKDKKILQEVFEITKKYRRA